MLRINSLSLETTWACTLRAFCLGLVLLGFLPSLRAEQFGLFTYRNLGNAIEITGYPQNAIGPVVVPADIDSLPVAQYVEYLPVRLRVALKDGKLTTRLKLHFAQPQGGTPAWWLDGDASLAALDVRRRDGAPLAAVARTDVSIERLDVAASALRIASVGVEGPALAVRRLDNGQLRRLRILAAGLAGDRARATALLGDAGDMSRGGGSPEEVEAWRWLAQRFELPSPGS